MRILLISHFFPPNRTAGAEKRALGYALELQKLGHSAQVVCAGDWDAGKQHWNGFTDEVYQGIPVRRVNFNWAQASDPNRSLYDNPLVEAQLDRWLEEWQPDVVHIISLVTLAAGAVRAVKKHGLPVVFTLTDFWMICPKISLVRGDGTLCSGQTTSWDCLKCLLWKTRAYQGLNRVLGESKTRAALERASRTPKINRMRGLRGMALDMDDRRRVMAEIAPMFDCITAPSTFLGSVMDKSGLFGRQVRIIHSGHDLAWLNDMPEKRPLKLVRLGYIGQLIPVKGVDLLIRAFQAADVEGKAELLIYGDAASHPKFASSLEAIARDSESIRFMGSFPHSRLGQVLAGMDVLVVPSQWHENNPRVIQEAFAGKTPVIASNVGGIAEFIQHGVNGLLFQYDQEDQLCDQIRRVVNEPVLVGELQRGIGKIRTITEEVEELVEIYERLRSQFLHSPVLSDLEHGKNAQPVPVDADTLRLE